MSSPAKDPAAAKRVSILHLEDNPDDAALVRINLRRDRFECDLTWVQDRQEFVQALATGAFDLILSDYRMPGFDGDQALKYAIEHHPELPFIMVTGELGEDRAIETLKRGATDYVLKGNLTRLTPAIERALRDAKAAAERRRTDKELTMLRESLALELADMRRLHDLSVRLLGSDDVNSVLHQVLQACTELLGANKGNVQIFDEEVDALRIVTQVGFDPEFLETFRLVPLGRGCVCSVAMKLRKRVIVEDIFADDRFSDARPSFARLGLSACTSTPLFCRDGKLFGMLSNHFDKPHRPSERTLQLLDLYIQQAEPVIEVHHASARIV